MAEQAILQYDCAFVDAGQPVGAEICGIPVVGGIADLSELRKDYELLVVGVGNNTFRAQVYEKAAAMGYTFPNIIAPSAYVSTFAKIGIGCVILQNACAQNGEPKFTAMPPWKITRSSIRTSVIRTGAQVGKCARIGSNVTVCNNAAVSDGADVPDCTAVHPEVRK